MDKRWKMLPLIAVVATLSTGLATAGEISVPVDQAKPYRIPPQAVIVAVGNNAIAEVTYQQGEAAAVITGRTNGITNIVAIDAQGNPILNDLIRVEPSAVGLVTVQRGATQRATYSCNPTCAPAAAVGDSADAFTVVAGQMQQRQNLAGQQQQ